MTRTGRPITPVQKDTAAHKVLTMLTLGGNANATELYAACAGRDDGLTVFRMTVLKNLRHREFIEAGPQGTLRITERGRIAIGAAPAPAPAARRGTTTAEGLCLAEGIERWMLTTSPGRARSMTEADKLPPPMRRDGQEHLQHPSRRGNRLYYRDGRVTDLAGNPLEVSA